ncbi:hypothetical protein D9613_001481 [Agrocybe pediades]|uniref:Uncharacterized protein n=1 Tax=Agrocybe pediades TaxID=84607 RepID=A0A8H4R7J5_9AGAR|nr:hypothetical protein D9613_001481 [Agrocybe pediades]
MSPDILQKAFDEISGYEPLDADSTPRKQKALKDAFIISRMMYEKARTLLQESGLPEPHSQDKVPKAEEEQEEEEQEQEERENEDPKKKRSQLEAIERHAEVMECLNNNDSARMMEEFLGSLHDNSRTTWTLMKKEQTGFVNLLRGYCPADSLEELRRHVPGNMTAMITEAFRDSIMNEENENVLDRMCERENVMIKCEETNTFADFALSVLNSIQCLEFAYEWERLKKAEKRAFLLQAFQSYHPTRESDDDERKKFQVFKNRHEKVITARNELLRMFKKFHSAVLMDPCWTPSACYTKGKTGRTRNFGATLTLFEDEIPDDELLEKNQTAFLQLMRVILGSEAYKYVKAFLNKHPYD